MLKRALFYILLIALLAVTTYTVYVDRKPKDASVRPEIINFRISPVYHEQSIDSYIMNSEEPVNILFYQEKNINSVYVFDTVLTRILDNYDLTRLEKLVYCDLTDMSQTSVTSTKNHWGFYEMPAFVRLQYREGNLTILSSLEWSETSSLTYDVVENWLLNNNIISRTPEVTTATQ